MNKFLVKNTFILKSNNCFVIAGEIIDGTIETGMSLLYTDETIEMWMFPIEGVGFIDKKENGVHTADVALYINMRYEKQFSDFIFKGRTFEIKN